VKRLRTAWRLWQSDDDLETVIAGALVAITVGPVLLAVLRSGAIRQLSERDAT
jgi:hypothetical protein